jgi:hypothetical protein
MLAVDDAVNAERFNKPQIGICKVHGQLTATLKDALDCNSAIAVY